MKKITAVIMAILMLLSFAACSDNTVTDEPSTDGAAAQVETSSDAVNRDEIVAPTVTGGEVDEIKANGKLVVGITDYAPMDYKDKNGEWTGFDAEFATAFAESIGVDVEFIEIDWDNKIIELDSGKIDCIWNGMTISEEITLNADVSDAYVKNAQCVIVNAADAANYPDVASLAGLSVAVEAGSAGESVANDNNLQTTALATQSAALMEVAAGTADACIIDLTMANAMTGEGTDYSDLGVAFSLSEEEYGVAFRQGSNLVDAVNEFMAANKDSVLAPLAEKYELTLAF